MEILTSGGWILRSQAIRLSLKLPLVGEVWHKKIDAAGSQCAYVPYSRNQQQSIMHGYKIKDVMRGKFKRSHIRLFESRGTSKLFTVGDAHREISWLNKSWVVVPCGFGILGMCPAYLPTSFNKDTITSWQYARREIKKKFPGEYALIQSSKQIPVNTKGTYQNREYDGKILNVYLGQPIVSYAFSDETDLDISLNEIEGRKKCTGSRTSCLKKGATRSFNKNFRNRLSKEADKLIDDKIKPKYRKRVKRELKRAIDKLTDKISAKYKRKAVLDRAGSSKGYRKLVDGAAKKAYKKYSPKIRKAINTISRLKNPTVKKIRNALKKHHLLPANHKKKRRK